MGWDNTDLKGGKTGMSKKTKNNSEFWYIVKVYLVSVIGALMTVRNHETSLRLVTDGFEEYR